MRKHENTDKLPMEFFVNTFFPFIRKVRTPSYCCAVLPDPRLGYATQVE